MRFGLANQYLAAEFSLCGGELYSLRDAEGTEYLWTGDEQIWPYRAAHMFPFTGRMTRGQYTYQGIRYPMEIHGFLKDTRMKLLGKTGQKAVLGFRSNEQTHEIYPFQFELELEYELNGSCLQITERVKNLGVEKMYFGIGCHPGFRIPWDGKAAFEAHYLEFDRAETPVRIGMTDSCFTDRSMDAALELEEGGILPLRHELFDRDALYVEGTGGRVLLKRKNTEKSILMEYPDMRYLGIWHRPHTDAPYVCLEPSVSLPSRQDIVEAAEEKPDLIALDAKKCYQNHWSISVLTDRL